jgi:hypothetical protein
MPAFSNAFVQKSTCHFDVRGLANPEVVGCDVRLNTSAEEITRFFLTHLKKPSESLLSSFAQ